MPHVPVAHLLWLLFAGLLAGFEVAVHYGIAAPPASFGEAEQIALRQSLIRRLRVLAPAIFLPSFLLALLIAFQERHQEGIWFRWAAVAALLVWIVIRIVRTVPVNSATLEWNPKAPPLNWQATVQKTEQLHVLAAWAAIFAFICSLVSVLQD